MPTRWTTNPTATDPEPGRLLLTVPQVEAATGLSRATVSRLLASGELRSMKIGRCRRVPADALRDWVAARLAAEEVAMGD